MPTDGQTDLVARSRAWSIVLLLVLFATAAALGASLPQFDIGALAGSRTAPDFTLDTVQHGTFRLSEHRGEIVVLDLMAVDCPSCRITEKAVLQLARERPDVTIVSVDIWTHFEDVAYLTRHMERLGADWPYAMDTDELLFKYSAYEISKVVVIGPDGDIAWSAIGGIEYAPLVTAVDAAAAGRGSGGGTLGLGLLGFAVFAGVASFFAPCAFPLLPGYFAYSLSRRADGAGKSGRPRLRHAILPGLAAASGIMIVYGLFGLVVAAFGRAASRFLPYLQPFVGLLAVVLGVALLLGATMERVVAPLQHGVERVRRRIVPRGDGHLVGYFSYGIGYGAAAAGCVAPVFLQLSLTALALGAWTGLQVFAVYAGVAGTLMVSATLAAVGTRGLLQRRAATLAQVIGPASGAVLIAAGIFIIAYFQRGFGLPGL